MREEFTPFLSVNGIIGKTGGGVCPLRVNGVKRGEKVLVLIDELARTTNPTEGRAIVNGEIE